MAYWYLCSSYTKHPAGEGRAFQVAARAAGVLLKAGIPVFSPVTHLHPVVALAEVDPRKYALWEELDEEFLMNAHGLIVLRDDGWEQNSGITFKMCRCRDRGKPVVFMDLGVIPADLLPGPNDADISSHDCMNPAQDTAGQQQENGR
jgi:hypothetical protein